MGARRVPRSVLFTAVLAALVTLGALGGVAALRGQDDVTRVDAGAPATPQAADHECGDAPCQVVATASVGATQVELLADAQGDNGRLQAGGQVVQTSITQLGARLRGDSLSCAVASVSACLVEAPLNGGRVGELVVQRDGDWHPVAKPYFSDAGVLLLSDVTGTDAPEVVVVQSSPALAEVYALDGGVVGCTKRYSYPAQIRGWPQVRVVASDLRSCS